MRKSFKNIIFILIMFIVIAPLTKVFADNPNVKTLTGSYADGKVNYSGTTDSGVLAVTCRLYDSNNQEVDMNSTSVSDNKFSGSFTAQEGTYTLMCANYDSGTIVSKEIDSRVEIESLTISLVNPIPGDKINIIEVDEGGFGFLDQDKLAEASTTDAGYKVEAAHYVKGKCSATSNLCEEYFEGTFEDGEDYYVMLDIESNEGYKLTTDTLDNVKINGEDPEELFAVYGDILGGTRTRVLAKVKATKNPASANSSTTNNSKTGDNIMTFIILAGISFVGFILTITLRKRKSN